MDDARPGIGARMYAFALRFLGPAQVGSASDPPTRPADPAYACPACGRPMVEHAASTVEGRRRLRCPDGDR